MTTLQKENDLLKDQVLSIINTIETGKYETSSEDEEPNAYDYLADALDIEYIIGSNGDYRGARVLVAFGGPNIWINTKSNTVEGAWWADSYFESYRNDALNLDDVLQELWECR